MGCKFKKRERRKSCNKMKQLQHGPEIICYTAVVHKVSRSAGILPPARLLKPVAIPRPDVQ